ncbi:putative F-box protein [Raphanus sativus]|nr:putative F-box protein [Raphanus sativus]
MDQSESKPNRPPVIPTWSDLCPDLLRSVFGLLSFTNLKSWNSASRSCVPKKNQIPWLILFPKENQTNSNNNCVLFVPDDKDNLYKTRDLGADFTQSSCVASYGSWLLMLDHFQNLYIINPLRLERIDLPHSYLSKKDIIRPCPACLWIDSITKNYLVVWIVRHGMVYTRKGDGRWRTGSIGPVQDAEKNFYNWKDQKVYITTNFSREVFIWDFSDDIPRQSGSLLPFSIYALRDDGPIHWARVLYFDSMIATTVTGQVLFVACLFQDSRWKFCMCGYDPLNKTWEKSGRFR